LATEEPLFPTFYEEHEVVLEDVVEEETYNSATKEWELTTLLPPPFPQEASTEDFKVEHNEPARNDGAQDLWTNPEFVNKFR
jgi:hypothetical protein